MYRCLSALAVLHNRDRISLQYTATLDDFLARVAASQIEAESDLNLTLEWVLELDVQFNLQNTLNAMQVTPEQLGGASFHDVMHYAANMGAMVLPSLRTQDAMEKAGQYAKTKGWTELSSALLDGVTVLRAMAQVATAMPASAHVH